MRRVTVSQLRANFDDLLDRVADTGQPIEVYWRGKIIKISVAATNSKLARLPRRPEFVLGGSADLVHKNWLSEWKP